MVIDGLSCHLDGGEKLTLINGFQVGMNEVHLTLTFSVLFFFKDRLIFEDIVFNATIASINFVESESQQSAAC